MRRAMLSGVAVLALALGSCAIADTLFGTQHNPDGTVTSDGKGGVIGGVANFFGLGWVTTLLGAVTTGYAAWKGKGWKGAALSTFDAIEKWKTSDDGKKHWEALKAKLGEAHAQASVEAIVEKALGNT